MAIDENQAAHRRNLEASGPGRWKPLDAEQICRAFKEDPKLVEAFNKIFMPAATSPPETTLDDEPTESHVTMITARRCATPENSKPIRRLILVKAAQNCDEFIPNWQQLATVHGDPLHYAQIDRNLPTMLPLRPNGVIGYFRDPPLTETGRFAAQLMGQTVLDAGLKIDRIFSAPQFDCLETADEIRKAAATSHSSQLPLTCVEPGLVGNLTSYADFVWPNFVDPSHNFNGNQLLQGLMIDSVYEPLFTVDELRLACGQQTVDDNNDRLHQTINRILTRSDQPITILVVGHAIAIDAAVHHLLKKSEDGSVAWQRIESLIPISHAGGSNSIDSVLVEQRATAEAD